jgi:hypothetical protein
MQRAASRAGDWKRRPGSTAVLTSSRDGFDYELSASAQGAAYSVSKGPGKLTATLEWVMGAGDLGQTFVYEQDGRWFQSRMSVYAAAPQLDVTTGLHVDADADLSSALGEPLTTADVRRCFGCHTVRATTTRGFNPLHAEAGLGCEACHGPGAAHTVAMTQMVKTGAHAKAGQDLAVFNPATLAPADSIDYCGSCHRTSADVSTSSNNANDVSLVRFQPYRLEKSRCWRATQDARLECVSCHDPHEPLNREPRSYDKRCVNCHRAADAGAGAFHGAKVCPVAKSQCVSCHMPKVVVASMHGQFTDHYIRIAKAGEGFVP